MTVPNVTLEPHKRGDTFHRKTTITGLKEDNTPWTFEDFTGGMFFTFRKSVPKTATVSDTDALDQATSATGEITGSGTSVRVKIPPSRTTNYPAQEVFWDLQGVVAGPEPDVYTLAQGTIQITSDITRRST